ncbi:MAG: hypothetical protein AB7Q17_00585 [Phycisphaerae bacterium]
MLFQRRIRKAESWDEIRARIIDETNAFLTECLQHPELATRIPIIPANSGRFPPSLTRAFWEPLLAE